MHLIDQARNYLYRENRSIMEPQPSRGAGLGSAPSHPRFRLALLGAKPARPFKRLLPDPRLRAMLEMAPKSIPPVQPQ